MKQDLDIADVFGDEVVSYRGTWVETSNGRLSLTQEIVVSYRGTWVETSLSQQYLLLNHVVSYRGTWVETNIIHL